MASKPPEAGRVRSAAAALAAAAAALAIYAPGLGSPGFWGAAELPLVERALARIGMATGTFDQAPILVDLLRAESLRRMSFLLGDEAAARLPGLLGVAALSALCAGYAAAVGLSRAGVALAVLVLLGLPLVAWSGSSTLGNPLAEAAELAAALSTASALQKGRPVRKRLAWFAAAAASSALAVASSGIVWGLALPLLAAAASGGMRRGRLLCAAAATGTLAVAAILAARQGDGFIPALAASKARAYLDSPAERTLATGASALLHQTFPWTPFVLLGIAGGTGRLKLPRAFAAGAVALSIPWILVYGTWPLPISVAAALCVADLADRPGAAPGHIGRFGLLVAGLGLLLLGKDAAAYPVAYATPLGPPVSEDFFPVDALDLGGRLRRLSHLVLLALVAGATLVRIRRARPLLFVLPLWAAGVLAFAVPHGIVRPALSRTSTAPLLSTFSALVDAGHLSPPLHVLRVDAPEIPRYLGAAPLDVPHRRTLAKIFAEDTAAAALVRKRELAGLFRLHRDEGFPLYVLDDRQAYVYLVANRRPPGMPDRNPLRRIVHDAPVKLAHTTHVRFEDMLELVAWEVEEPVVRGSYRKLRLLFHVLGRVPSGAKVVGRLQAGRLSRVSAEPQPFTGGLYPPTNFRPGEYILHEHEIRTPVLDVLSGPHDLVVGIRRNEKRNLRITDPAGRKGPHGVRIVDRAHTFARIGRVRVF